MCNECVQYEPTVISRRMFMSAIGAGVVAALTGCAESGSETTPKTADLRSGIPSTFEPPYTKPHQIIPRSMWAKAGPDETRIKPMNGVQLVTYHHSAEIAPFTTTGIEETAQHLENVRVYHRAKNFNDIGYHYAIDRVGRIWELRQIQYQGQHCRFTNEHNIGIMVLGNFNLQQLTTAQAATILAFTPELRQQYQLPIAKLFTHHEIVGTPCPGKYLQDFITYTRQQRLV